MKHQVKIFSVCLLVLLFSTGVDGQKVICTKTDSTKVIKWLQDGIKMKGKTNLFLYFAHRFIGTPYVPSTLERVGEESLVINVSGVDCTTFVEYCFALDRTVRQNKTDFKTFCRNLTQIRYEGGHLGNYTTRNHYFSWWINSNQQQGLIHEINNAKLFCGRQNLQLSYMSTHTEAYKQLSNNKRFVSSISQHEKATSGHIVNYIPKTLLKKNPRNLNIIHDGDILAIVTNKRGLDTSHIGIAVWENGYLHLLNASSIHHKVVLETKPLWQYMQEHPSQIGIRVVRIV
jgi:hypothetical protein